MLEEYRNKYLNLIKFRIRNKLPKDEVVHLHHIVPKFTKPKRNGLVKLTPKEHCLAHYYLWKGFAKSKNKKAVKYLFNAYKGLSITFGSDNDKNKRMRQFQKDIEKELDKFKEQINERHYSKLDLQSERAREVAR